MRRELIVLFCGVAAWLQTMTSAVPAEDAVARGKYLATIGICASCHMPNFAGGRRTGGNLSANLTPDKETGLGAWNDDEIVEAIRNGKRPDGGPVRPSMGVFWYHDLSDTDVRAIVAFLRQLPPVRVTFSRLPVTAPPPVLRPAVTSVADVPRSDKVAYGGYIVGAVSHCLQCHTPRAKNGQPDFTRLGAGGNKLNVPGGGTAIAPNLTPGNPNGIVGWTDAQVKDAITKGVRPDGGKMVPVMDFEFYEHMTAEDLDAVVAFLRSLKPVPPG